VPNWARSRGPAFPQSHGAEFPGARFILAGNTFERWLALQLSEIAGRLCFDGLRKNHARVFRFLGVRDYFVIFYHLLHAHAV
jgi:hypothetical protein